MAGRSLAVYFPSWQGQGAATLLRSASCRRHWLGAITVLLALKIQISQGLDGWLEWADGHRQYIFPADMDDALQHYRGPSCRWHWLGATTNSTKNSYCFCSDLSGPGRLAGVGGRTSPVHLPGGHGRGATTFQRLGHAQHQQPQCQHPQEVLPGRPRLYA
jgi:hypothetical protein